LGRTKYNSEALSEAPRNTLNSPASGSPAQTDPQILKWSLRILVLTSIGLCMGFDITRMFITKAPTKIAQPYALWDSWIANATVPGHGLFLKFDSFPPAGAGYAQNIYYRAVYDLFPQPLLVAGPGTKISDGHELLKHNDYPGDQWLRSQGVDSVMTIQIDKKKNLPVVSDVRWLGE
jgi:hypothetical protein